MVLLVTTPEPTSIADTYSALKNIVHIRGAEEIWLVVNRAENKLEGIRVAERLEAICEQFMQLKIQTLGYVINDDKVAEGVLRQQPVITLYPRSLAASNFRAITEKLVADETKINSFPKRSGLKGFLTKVLEFVK